MQQPALPLTSPPRCPDHPMYHVGPSGCPMCNMPHQGPTETVAEAVAKYNQDLEGETTFAEVLKPMSAASMTQHPLHQAVFWATLARFRDQHIAAAPIPREAKERWYPLQQYIRTLEELTGAEKLVHEQLRKYPPSQQRALFYACGAPADGEAAIQFRAVLRGEVIAAERQPPVRPTLSSVAEAIAASGLAAWSWFHAWKEASAIFGFKHEDPELRTYFHSVYGAICYALHAKPESEEELDRRLT